MSKTIGLCIAFAGTNYGMHLQGYATQYIIEKSGFETEIIDYHSGANKGIKFSIGALYVGIRKIANKVKSGFPMKRIWIRLIKRINSCELMPLIIFGKIGCII